MNSAGRLAATGLAWLAGVAWHLRLAELPSPAMAAAVALCSVAGAGWALALRRRGRPGALAAVWLLMWAAAGLGWSSAVAQAQWRLAQALPLALEGVPLQVTGVVASLPQQRSTGVGFVFEVEAVQSPADARGAEPAAALLARVPARLALFWSVGRAGDDMAGPQPTTLRAGQRWRLQVRLRQPHGNANPGGWDAELQWFERDLRATGSVRGPAEMLDAQAGQAVQRLRQAVRDAIDAQVPDRRTAGVLAALAVGDQSAIEREDWEVFRNTGVAHVVAISGLHITMLAWLAGGWLRRLWGLSPRAALRWPAPAVQRWGGCAVALAYSVLSGWGVPSQRTVWMLLTVACLRSLGRHWPWPLVLLAAAVVVTALDPWALLQAGFWLSFMAVGLLMASARAQPEPARPWPPGWPGAWQRLGAAARAAARTQWLATLGLAPLTLVFFQQLSVVGLLANLVTLPLVTLLVTPLALLGVVWAPLWSLGGGVLQGLMAYLSVLSAWPWAVWTVPAAPLWAQLAGLLAAALLVMPLPWRWRWWALPLALPLLLPPVDRPAPGQFELLALDVGQGTSVLVRTREHLLVYDAGPMYAPDSDAGQRIVLPLLRWRGERRIDMLLLSHRDTDHVGGARALLAAMPVGELLSSLEPEHPLWALAPRTRRCQTGQSWQWDGVRFEILHPGPEATPQWRPNAVSCVLRVSSAQGRSALLTGDIEMGQELAMVGRIGGALKSDVLLVPHHGSRTSSTAPFLAAVQARVGVVQSGYRNRFGHPAPDVVARLRASGLVLRDSPACGAWAWSSAGGEESMAGACWRLQTRRYWQHDLRD